MTKIVLRSLLVFFFSFIYTSHAYSDEGKQSIPAFPVCMDFPSILGSGSPSGAVTGYPFTFFVRFSCLLGDRFDLVGLEGVYRLPNGTQLPQYIGIPMHRLRDGNFLYQFFHSIPYEQEGGTYEMNGCVRIADLQMKTSVCLPVSATMRVRPRPAWF